MLLLDAEIYFYKHEYIPNARYCDLDVTMPYRVPINFGNDILLTASFTFDKSLNIAVRGEKYRVYINIFITNEIFEHIKYLVAKSSKFKITENTKNYVGEGKILDYIYESEE